MKKLFIVLLIILIALVGCGANNNEQDGKKLSYNANDSLNNREIIPNAIKNDPFGNYVNKNENENEGNDRLNNANEILNNAARDDTASQNNTNSSNNDANGDNLEGSSNNNAKSDVSLLQNYEGFLNSYTTKILTSDENRYNNIKIVSDRLNGYVLKPGATFSFNEVCGPYGQSDGFLEATILLSDGTSSKGYGGGVCQLSSTVYNAVKTLNIDITERHHHSAPVAYVPENEDATVSLQSDLDFKFVNKGSTPIKFRTAYDPNNLTVAVYESY